MKKQLIKTGIITLTAVLNLTLTFDLSWGSQNQGSIVQTPSSFSKEEYLKIIELLTQQIKANEDQIENAKKVHQSITGNKIRPSDITISKNPHQFLQDPIFIYPSPQKKYVGMTSHVFKNRIYIEGLMTNVNQKEKRVIFPYMSYKDMFDVINLRLQYSGIVEKAVSLQTFQDAEMRFTQIAHFLNNIYKTKDLREVFELQTRIKNMSAMLQNEYAKLQMVRNLSNNEEFLIEIQKRMLYRKIINNSHKRMPQVTF